MANRQNSECADSSDEDDKDQYNLEAVYKNFPGNSTDLYKTKVFIDNCFQSGNLTCLVCLRRVKNTDPVG